MAFSLINEEIQHMIQNILHRRLGFRPRRDAIHITGVKASNTGSNELVYVRFHIKDTEYVIDWSNKEIIIKGEKYWHAIDFDGRY